MLFFAFFTVYSSEEIASEAIQEVKDMNEEYKIKQLLKNSYSKSVNLRKVY